MDPLGISGLGFLFRHLVFALFASFWSGGGVLHLEGEGLVHLLHEGVLLGVPLAGVVGVGGPLLGRLSEADVTVKVGLGLPERLTVFFDFCGCHARELSLVFAARKLHRDAAHIVGGETFAVKLAFLNLFAYHIAGGAHLFPIAFLLVNLDGLFFLFLLDFLCTMQGRLGFG